MNIRIVLLVLFIPAAAFAQSPESSDISRVLELNRKWIASYATRDTATMQRILADDFTMISPSGANLDRKDIIRNVGTRDQTSTGSIDSASVRIFGETGLIVAYTHFTIQSNGRTTKGANCYSDLYVKRKGVWKAVAAHVTVLGSQ